MTTNSFFDELNEEGVSGVAYKNLELKKRTIAYFANIGNATIADLSRELNSSAPKITTLISELIADGMVKDYGKVDSTGGRRPSLYGISSDSGFFVGVEVKQHYINIGLLNFKKNLVNISERIPYRFSDSKEALDDLCTIILQFIESLQVPKNMIFSLGLNLAGRVNYFTGYSYSTFFFSEEPLNKVIERKIGIRTFVENDSRAMAYGEFSSGVVRNEKNVLFINVDYGLGMGILINGQIYYGKSGFSGELGHIPFFNNEIICSCGKKGCLETEASGSALVRLFKQKIKEGSTSILTNAPDFDIDNIKLEDIIKASLNDDMLAIDLMATIGEKVGRGISMLMNLFNPELVVVGGILSSSGNYILFPIKSAINKYSLALVNNDTELRLSTLGDKAGIIGASLLARNKILSLN